MIDIEIVHDFLYFLLVKFDFHFGEDCPDFLLADGATSVLIEDFEGLLEVLDIQLTDRIHRNIMNIHHINDHIGLNLTVKLV